ncbi:MAG: hypothetical protein ACYDH4_10165 [Candidatus Cryosericum sp.]
MPALEEEKQLVAPPCNEHLSELPNKSQTILNIVRGEGPMKRSRLLARMQELLGPKLATKNKIRSLSYQLSMSGRLDIDFETDMVSMPENPEPSAKLSRAACGCEVETTRVSSTARFCPWHQLVLGYPEVTGENGPLNMRRLWELEQKEKR